MVFYKKNYYHLRLWTSCSCGTNTNGYLFTYPPPGMHIEKVFYSTQSNEEYAAFLSECDITGTRKKHNMKLYLKKLKKQIWIKEELGWYQYWYGDKYVNQKVERYARKKGLLFGDEYPVWRKPVVMQIPAESVFWKYDTVHNSFVCLNDDVLQQFAKKCDILLLGEDMAKQWVVCANRNPTCGGENWYLKISQIQGQPSAKFIEQHPNWREEDFCIKKAYTSPVSMMRRKRLPIELSDLLSSPTSTIASSWENQIINHKIEYKAINISPEVFNPVRVKYD